MSARRDAERFAGAYAISDAPRVFTLRVYNDAGEVRASVAEVDSTAACEMLSPGAAGGMRVPSAAFYTGITFHKGAHRLSPFAGRDVTFAEEISQRSPACRIIEALRRMPRRWLYNREGRAARCPLARFRVVQGSARAARQWTEAAGLPTSEKEPEMSLSMLFTVVLARRQEILRAPQVR